MKSKKILFALIFLLHAHGAYGALSVEKLKKLLKKIKETPTELKNPDLPAVKAVEKKLRPQLKSQNCKLLEQIEPPKVFQAQNPDNELMEKIKDVKKDVQPMINHRPPVKVHNESLETAERQVVEQAKNDLLSRSNAPGKEAETIKKLEFKQPQVYIPRTQDGKLLKGHLYAEREKMQKLNLAMAQLKNAPKEKEVSDLTELIGKSPLGTQDKKESQPHALGKRERGLVHKAPALFGWGQGAEPQEEDEGNEGTAVFCPRSKMSCTGTPLVYKVPASFGVNQSAAHKEEDGDEGNEGTAVFPSSKRPRTHKPLAHNAFDSFGGVQGAEQQEGDEDNEGTAVFGGLSKKKYGKSEEKNTDEHSR
jgi:hypothetical protein